MIVDPYPTTPTGAQDDDAPAVPDMPSQAFATDVAPPPDSSDA